MRVEIVDDYTLEVTGLDESGVPAEPRVNAVQLLGLALAQCTYTVLATYGERLNVSASGIRIALKMTPQEAPKRISAISMDVRWPDLPESRLDAATRAARHCTVHATLSPGVEVDVLVDN